MTSGNVFSTMVLFWILCFICFHGFLQLGLGYCCRSWVWFAEQDGLVWSSAGINCHCLVRLRSCIITLVNSWKFLRAFILGLKMWRRIALPTQLASAVLDPKTDLSCKVSIILLCLINMCKFSLVLTYNWIHFGLLFILFCLHHWQTLFNQWLLSPKLLHKWLWWQICFTQIHVLNIQFRLLFS